MAAMLLAIIAAAIVAQAPASPPAPSIDEAVRRGVEIILSLQEGEEGGPKNRWPYEGVYRVDRQIPIGYEVGGTAICATALLRAPGFADDPARVEAVARATDFICASIDHPLMSIDNYDAGYDVRGWGYTYGLAFLLELKATQPGTQPPPAPEIAAKDGSAPPQDSGPSAPAATKNAPPQDAAPRTQDSGPATLASARDRAIAFFLDGIHRTEIPGVGGWNYARPPGRANAAPSSPFMTAPTLLALFEAKRQGYTVDEAVVARALDTLEAARTPAGGIVYAGKAGENRRDAVPGATGRMLSAETALFLAGRGSAANIRGSLDAFITHWDWLEQRRAKTGTHVGPYAIAPYYFYFAHYHAAMAIELLPEGERAEYRRRVHELVFRTRAEVGSWNDRVFPRSANYGTAMSTMALLMPGTSPPASWRVGK